jgi:hypothetical protein
MLVFSESEESCRVSIRCYFESFEEEDGETHRFPSLGFLGVCRRRKQACNCSGGILDKFVMRTGRRRHASVVGVIRWICGGRGGRPEHGVACLEFLGFK